MHRAVRTARRPGLIIDIIKGLLALAHMGPGGPETDIERTERIGSSFYAPRLSVGLLIPILKGLCQKQLIIGATKLEDKSIRRNLHRRGVPTCRGGGE